MSKLRLAFPTCQQPALVTHGTGAARSLAEADIAGEAAWFLGGGAPVRAQLDAALGRRGLSLAPERVLNKPPGEPSWAAITEGAAFVERLAPARIVAIGGGSVLDWARLSWAKAAGCLTSDATFDQSATPALPRPWTCLVPTTCGSGAEASAVAVFSAEDGRKVPVVSRAFLADLVVLDGRFLDSVSERTLACSLGDALSHAAEAFLSPVPNYLAKEAALSALRLLLRHAPAAPAPSRNDRLMEAGYLAGVGASNCSVGVIHAFAHSMARWGAGHGQANAVALVAGLRANAHAPAMARLLDALGLDSVAALEILLKPLLQPAMRLAPPAGEVLRNPETIPLLVQAIAGDVCMKTNPVPLAEGEIRAFVGDVAAALETVQP